MLVFKMSVNVARSILNFEMYITNFHESHPAIFEFLQAKGQKNVRKYAKLIHDVLLLFVAKYRALLSKIH
jgi:hypothetical protein